MPGPVGVWVAGRGVARVRSSSEAARAPVTRAARPPATAPRGGRVGRSARPAARVRASASEVVRSRICASVGRASGSLRRQSRTRSSRPSGMPARSGSSCAMRNISACTPLSAEPKGRRPVAAYARTEPRQKTSQAAVTRSPRTCSGAMKPGEPTSAPVRVSPPSVTVSRARAMPKSMTRGPSMVTRTLDGLRSRWMRPAAWMSCRACARPAARMRTERSGSGPWSPETTVWSAGPAT